MIVSAKTEYPSAFKFQDTFEDMTMLELPSGHLFMAWTGMALTPHIETFIKVLRDLLEDALEDDPEDDPDGP